MPEQVDMLALMLTPEAPIGHLARPLAHARGSDRAPSVSEWVSSSRSRVRHP